MKNIKNNLPKYWLVMNDGSQIFKDTVIQYLTDTYGETWNGDALYYYGYSGNNLYKGTCVCSNSNIPRNNPTLLTINEFIELSKPILNMIDFKLKDTKLPVIPVGTIYKCRSFGSNVYKSFTTECIFYSYGYREIEGIIYIEAESKEYTGGVYFMIKESDIIRLAKEQGMIKEEVMEKEIIGYKLKDDCEKYKQAALSICNTVANWKNSQMFYDIKASQTGYISKLAVAGVLDLWFEPVYKDKFKIGDWIIDGNDEESEAGKITSITEIFYCINDSNPKTWSFNKITPGLRLATPEEIENSKYPNIIINGYKGKFFNEYVKFGCAKIHKNIFTDLNTLNLDLKNADGVIGMKSNKLIESITIGKGTFTKEQIKEIAEYYNAKISK